MRTCQVELPLTPSQSIYCGDQAVSQALLGCRHEHLETTRLCSHHYEVAVKSRLTCPPCFLAGLEVSQALLSSVPLATKGDLAVT